MRRSNRELWLALLAVLIITAGYLAVVNTTQNVPAASGLFGHSLGILGFVLMLCTETLYSLRKRARSARWGRMSTWLQFHIFTGLVGPYLTLLHSAWKFNGLAGIVLLLTVVIVISGFIGRYIFTAVPRTADGAEIQAREIGAQIHRIEEELSRQVECQLPGNQLPGSQLLARRLMTLPSLQSSSPATVLGRIFEELSFALTGWQEQRRLPAVTRAQIAQLERLAGQRRQLYRQMESLAIARRLLAVWHAVHIPIGAALFIAAFVHIGAAVYYATLLH